MKSLPSLGANARPSSPIVGKVFIPYTIVIDCCGSVFFSLTKAWVMIVTNNALNEKDCFQNSSIVMCGSSGGILKVTHFVL
jgi:hypothetical protein